jgi:hypothetical protein
MTQREKSRNPIRRVTRALKNVFTHSAFTRHRSAKKPEPAIEREAKPAVDPPHVRPMQRRSDIPMDVLIDAYSPTQTSLKAPFRADGSDHQSDQEFGNGPENDRWRNEDRFTNKSGDPRIGTHGRTYEPAGNRASSKEGETEWTRTRP